MRVRVPSDPLMTAREEIEAFKRKLLAERLEKITPEQKSKFDRIFPTGVPFDRIISAIDICDRTIKKNSEEKT